MPQEAPSDVQLVLEAVGKMPSGATLEQIFEELGILVALRRAEENIQAGKFVTQQEAELRSASWITK